MKRRYYSQRENGGGQKITLDNLKKIFSAIYNDFYEKKYFCEHLNLGCCVDWKDDDLSGVMLRKIRRADLWPFFDEYNQEGKLKDFDKNALFDVIEFLYDHISEPIDDGEVSHHSWGNCGFHYSNYSQEEGQKRFREEINESLIDFEDGYELSEEGEILHKADRGLDKLLEAKKVDVGKGDIPERMIEAEKLFYNSRSNIKERKRAVKELADCFEFLRNDVKKVLNKKDESDLFNIANKFSIRHHNENQKDNYDPNIWLSWMFHFYLATLHASLRLVKKEQQNE